MSEAIFCSSLIDWATRLTTPASCSIITLKLRCNLPNSSSDPVSSRQVRSPSAPRFRASARTFTRLVRLRAAKTARTVPKSAASATRAQSVPKAYPAGAGP